MYIAIKKLVNKMDLDMISVSTLLYLKKAEKTENIN